MIDLDPARDTNDLLADVREHLHDDLAHRYVDDARDAFDQLDTRLQRGGTLPAEWAAASPDLLLAGLPARDALVRRLAGVLGLDRALAPNPLEDAVLAEVAALCELANKVKVPRPLSVPPPKPVEEG